MTCYKRTLTSAKSGCASCWHGGRNWGQGLVDIARHVIGCRSTQEMRVKQNALSDAHPQYVVRPYMGVLHGEDPTGGGAYSAVDDTGTEHGCEDGTVLTRSEVGWCRLTLSNLRPNPLDLSDPN